MSRTGRNGSRRSPPKPSLERSGNGAVILTVVALGLLRGQPSGPMLSPPARMLQPATQAIGMGIFDTVYYAAMMHGPIVAGACAKSAGSAASGIRLLRHRAAGMPFAALGGFNRLPALIPPTTRMPTLRAT